VTSDPRLSGLAAPSLAQGTVVPPRRCAGGSIRAGGRAAFGRGGRDAAAGREPGGAVAGDLAARQQEAEAAHRQLFEGIERYLAGDLPAAVKELRAALFHLPGCWPAAYYLALTHDALGRFDEARRLYAEVLQRHRSGHLGVDPSRPRLLLPGTGRRCVCAAPAA
jgi:tetratricopeptide (TPR) repeat protein